MVLRLSLRTLRNQFEVSCAIINHAKFDQDGHLLFLNKHLLLGPKTGLV